jgi:hypothetical protein
MFAFRLSSSSEWLCSLLDRNRITFVEPGTFQQLHNLSNLHIGYNRLANIDGVVSNIPSLKELRMQNNTFASLQSDHLANNTALTFLFVSQFLISFDSAAQAYRKYPACFHCRRLSERPCQARKFVRGFIFGLCLSLIHVQVCLWQPAFVPTTNAAAWLPSVDCCVWSSIFFFVLPWFFSDHSSIIT